MALLSPEPGTVIGDHARKPIDDERVAMQVEGVLHFAEHSRQTMRRQPALEDG